MTCPAFRLPLFLWMVLALDLLARAQGVPIIVEGPTQPTGQLKEGTAVNLRVLASGADPLSYQWQRNGVSIRGATLATFSIPRFTRDLGGAISVSVANKLGSVKSKSVRLVPALTTLPFTDALDPRSIGDKDFPNRISGLTGAGVGSNSRATVERKLGEPLHAGGYGGASMWLVWKPGVNGIATLSTRGSGFDTVLAVYVQADARQPIGYGNLKLVAANDDAETYRTSEVQFNTISTTTYYIAVDGDGSGLGLSLLKDTVQRGDIVFQWEVESTLQKLPVYTSIFSNQNLIPDSGLRLNGLVDAAGSEGASYQWFFQDRLVEGVTGSELVFSKITPALVGRYYCQAALKYGLILRTTKSPVVDVQIFRRSDNTDNHVMAQDKFSVAADYTFGGGAAALSNRRAAPAASGRRDPLGVSLGTSGTQIFNTLGAGKDEGEPDHCGVEGGASEWYALRADTDGVIIADTGGSNFDTVLAAYYDNGTGVGLYDGLVNVACNNDAPGLGQQSRLVFPCVAGRIYYLAVDGVNGATGTAFLNYVMSSRLGILQHPGSLTANAGGSAVFSVNARGAGNLRYQWRKNGIDLPGQTGPVLTLAAVQAGDEGQYSVVVLDDLASETSIPATLVINLPVTITAHPLPVIVNPGGTATFLVGFSGTGPFSLQWLKNGSVLPGQTGATLTLNNVQAGDAAQYSVVVSNVVGPVTSAASALTINSPVTITAHPLPVTVNSGGTATFSVGFSGTAPFSFQWLKNGSFLAGQTGATLTLNNVQAGDAAQYSVVVSNVVGPVASAASALTVNSPVTITAHPLPVTVNQGGTATFLVGFSGTTPVTFQWLKNGAALAGQVGQTLTLNNVQAGDAAQYSVVVSNVVGPVTSAASALTVNGPVTITANPLPVTVSPGGTASFSVAFTGTAPVTFQWLKNGAALAGQVGQTLTLNNVQAGDAAQYSVVVSNVVGPVTSVASALTVNSPVTITANPLPVTVNPGGTASFSVAFTGTAPVTFQWLKNGAVLTGQVGQTLTLNNVQAGDAGQYSVVVSNVVGPVTSAASALTVNSPVTITAHPLPVTVNPSGTASFSVAFTGTAPVTFQWLKNGAALAGQVGQTLTLNNAQAADAGQYSVVVRNVVGPVTSAAAALVVRLAPVITTQPAPVTVNPGGFASFSVSATGTGPLNYQWRKNGLPLAGKTTATLTLNNVQAADAGQYSVTVQNIVATVASLDAQLKVNLGARPILAVERSTGGQMKVSVGGSPGTSYVLERSTNLITWTPIHTNLSGGFEYIDPPQGAPVRWFRAFRR